MINFACRLSRPSVDRCHWQAVIGNEHLLKHSSSFTLGAVGKTEAVNFEARKDFMDFRRVIQRQQKSAFERLQQAREFHKVCFSKIELIMLEPEIWRVDIKEGRWAITFSQDLFVWQPFKLNAKKPFMGQMQLHRDAVWIVVCGILYRKRKGPPVDQARETVLFQVEKARRALDVGQSAEVSLLQYFEPPPALNEKLQIAY